MQRWNRHGWTSNLDDDNRSREFRYKNIDSNLTEYGKGEKLWCYQCNTNLRNRHTTECNDPYPSSYFDLTLCPRNESHHCLKSIIDYGDVLVTVRGCVPSREIDGYCQQAEHFPGSSIKCSFCDDYACNSQNSNRVSNNLILIILTSITSMIYLF
ncbi:uncharacterized protein LOC100867805 isoform X1 [Apis florea]|uniref:uncharacterized protein LOC100867805 isoform X1 n=1 Tax=Apis florea TaxID=7463 RepID=UPI000628FDB2|nr:uncharacterized protein LOC100867805 isoform X1 [Apis florea]